MKLCTHNLFYICSVSVANSHMRDKIKQKKLKQPETDTERNAALRLTYREKFYFIAGVPKFERNKLL